MSTLYHIFNFSPPPGRDLLVMAAIKFYQNKSRMNRPLLDLPSSVVKLGQMASFNQPILQFIFRPEVAIPFFIWVTFWKGLSLWKAAGKRHLTWFVVLLVVNTLGLLEIAYIFYLHRWEIGNGKLLAFLEEEFKRLKKILNINGR